MDRTVADPMIGRVLDRRYRVGQRIARGGMATVYEATDLRLDRTCALKVMHASLGDDDDFANRFVREARSAARLSHPHVVSVFDQGDDDGTLFLAMEHVPGHTLRDLIRQEAPMAPGRALAILDPVLSALGAAHQAGMIHRDVKPENVLVADDGRIKVADFGLARAVSAETQHTATGGVLIGTVSYLSPELVVDGRADARSDVYAVGVVLYEMLTGRKPHEGDSPIQVAYQHVHEDVPPPSRTVPGLPPYVDALVARATARDRDLRPADARVLLHQVRRVRDALDHQVTDDPDLTSDLTPTTVVPRLTEDIDYVREDLDGPGDADDLRTILTPAQVAHAGRTDDTSVIGDRPVPGRGGRTHDESRRSRRSRRGPVLLLVVLLLAVAAGVGGWWFGEGRYVATPGVLNVSPHAASARMRHAGLSFTVTGRSWSETVPSGLVMSTDPSGGQHVTRHGTVTGVVSRGPERHRVPTLRGRSLDTSQATLARDHLSYGRATYAYSTRVARGDVVSSSPRPGTSLHRNAAVDLLVSRGPQPVKVPHVTGYSLTSATAALDRLHLHVRTTRRHSDTVAKGEVISQSPSTGRLLPGAVVRLSVSQGPVLVRVPEVRRMSTSEATSILEAAGFTVRVDNLALYVGLHLVVKQTPDSSQLAPRGSTVVLYVV